MSNDTNDQQGSLQIKTFNIQYSAGKFGNQMTLLFCLSVNLSIYYFLSANLSICGEGCLLYISRDDMADMSRVRSSSMWILQE